MDPSSPAAPVEARDHRGAVALALGTVWLALYLGWVAFERWPGYHLGIAVLGAWGLALGYYRRGAGTLFVQTTRAVAIGLLAAALLLGVVRVIDLGVSHG